MWKGSCREWRRGLVKSTWKKRPCTKACSANRRMKKGRETWQPPRNMSNWTNVQFSSAQIGKGTAQDMSNAANYFLPNTTKHVPVNQGDSVHWLRSGGGSVGGTIYRYGRWTAKTEFPALTDKSLVTYSLVVVVLNFSNILERLFGLQIVDLLSPRECSLFPPLFVLMKSINIFEANYCCDQYVFYYRNSLAKFKRSI